MGKTTQIVIEIPSIVKEWVDAAESSVKRGDIVHEWERVIGNAIANGIVLPDEHGNLIDANSPKLKNSLEGIQEAEEQVYGKASFGFSSRCRNIISEAEALVPATE